MSESTGKRQSVINKVHSQDECDQTKRHKNETQDTICSDMFRKLDN